MNPSFRLVRALIERKLNYVFDKCNFFPQNIAVIIDEIHFLIPFEQETFQGLAYHHHPQNLQAVQLQQVFNS